MSKLAKKKIEDQLEDNAKYKQKQTEKEIFTNTDAEGFNHNSSEQHNYPGVQKHTPRPAQRKNQ